MQSTLTLWLTPLNFTMLRERLKACEEEKNKTNRKEKMLPSKSFFSCFQLTWFHMQATAVLRRRTERLINTKRIEKWYFVVNPFAFCPFRGAFFRRSRLSTQKTHSRRQKSHAKCFLFIDVTTFTCELYRFYAVINGVSDRNMICISLFIFCAFQTFLYWPTLEFWES